MLIRISLTILLIKYESLTRRVLCNIILLKFVFKFVNFTKVYTRNTNSVNLMNVINMNDLIIKLYENSDYSSDFLFSF